MFIDYQLPVDVVDEKFTINVDQSSISKSNSCPGYCI